MLTPVPARSPGAIEGRPDSAERNVSIVFGSTTVAIRSSRRWGGRLMVSSGATIMSTSPKFISPCSSGAVILSARPLRFSRAGSGDRASVGEDRKRVVEGKSVSVRVEFGGRRFIEKKKQK